MTAALMLGPSVHGLVRLRLVGALICWPGITRPTPGTFCIMRVLIACEFSGVVRDAFAHRGHDAWSCDLLPSEQRGNHIWSDLIQLWDNIHRWDLIIAHPPCTDLAASGARWFPAKRASGSQQKAIDFFMMIATCGCPRIAIENPIGIMSRLWRKPDQIIQPWQFGHGETKATCLWLKGLHKLVPTNIVQGREHRIWRIPPSGERWKERSRTYQGVADAMAAQWGS